MRKVLPVVAALFAAVSFSAYAADSSLQLAQAEKSKRGPAPAQATDNDPAAQGKDRAPRKAGEPSKRKAAPAQATDNDPAVQGKDRAPRKAGEPSKRGPVPQQQTDNDPAAQGKGKK